MLDSINKEFFLRTNTAEKPPKISDNDIAICCPVCKEGKSWNKKQRCHLYYDKNIKTELVKCFNCGITLSLPNYLKMIDKNLYEEYKAIKRKEYLLKLQNKRKDTSIEAIIDKKESKEFIVFEVPKEFIPCKNNENCLEFLRKRKLLEFTDLFFFSEKDIELGNKYIRAKNTIITPLWYKNKLYGFQCRDIEKKRFYTFLPNSGLKVWNWFDSNKEKPVFIFESVFDALSSGLPVEKIIANLGIDFPKHLLEQITPIFCLDNYHYDEASRKKLIELAREYYVFLWPKIWNGRVIKEKDFNELRQKGWKYEEIKNMILNNLGTGTNAIIKIRLGK